MGFQAAWKAFRIVEAALGKEEEDKETLSSITLTKQEEGLYRHLKQFPALKVVTFSASCAYSDVTALKIGLNVRKQHCFASQS